MPFAYDQTNIYYMTHQKYEPINQYKKSSFKDEYSYLYRNDKINGKKLQNNVLRPSWSCHVTYSNFSIQIFRFLPVARDIPIYHRWP